MSKCGPQQTLHEMGYMASSDTQAFSSPGAGSCHQLAPGDIWLEKNEIF